MLKTICATTILLLATVIVSDNFNDGVIDTNLWTSGVAVSTQSFNVRPDLVTVDESSGQLVFTESGNQSFYGMNAYVTNAAYDVRGKRVSAKLSRSGGLDVWLAAGTDRFNMVQAQLIDDGNGGVLVLTQSYLNSVEPTDYFYTQSADVQDYIGLRFSANGNIVYCETSADGVNWNTRGTLKHHLPYFSTSRIEIGGGGYRPYGGIFTATADDFKLEP